MKKWRGCCAHIWGKISIDTLNYFPIYKILKTSGCVVVLLLLSNCDNRQLKKKRQETKSDTAQARAELPKKVEITYHALSLKKGLTDSLKKLYRPSEIMTILTLNRIDIDHIQRADTIIIPDQMLVDLNQYSPYPQYLPILKNIHKIIFFSYATQAFGVYESGKLVRWGATNMGKKIHPTPTGVFYANWKAEETISTDNDEWILKWNVNVENKHGIGWHQYVLPGYPASHSCLRLMEHDALYLYDWVDQWKLKNSYTIILKGTPVVIFGTYPFGGRKPWKALLTNPYALDIDEKTINAEVEPHLPEIIRWQEVRDSISSSVL